MIFSAIVIAVTIAVLLFFIITDKRIKIGKKSLGLYCLVPLIGAVVLAIGGRLPLNELADYFVSDTAVNPIKILSLFLSMTVFSVVLDEAGFFTYVANLAVGKSGSDQRRLFFIIYLTVAVLTVFTSNDVVILTVTPFVIAFCRQADCNPIPHLLLEFVTANTWSMLLVIGNPTNIYVASAFGITFLEYLATMVLPTLAGGIASCAVVYVLFRKSLAKPMSPEKTECKLKDKPLAVIAGVHLAVCVVLLAVSNLLKIEMWLISVSLALLLIVCTLIYLAARRKPFSPLTNSLKRLPYEIIPFVVGMFAIVLVVGREGWCERIYRLFENFNPVFAYGFGTAICSNLINNIPATVLFSQVLTSCATQVESLSAAVYATIAGSNVGAYLTPVGALAGIMWHNILSHSGVKLSFGKFCLYGVTVAIPTLAATLIVLALVV